MCTVTAEMGNDKRYDEFITGDGVSAEIQPGHGAEFPATREGSLQRIRRRDGRMACRLVLRVTRA